MVGGRRLVDQAAQSSVGAGLSPVVVVLGVAPSPGLRRECADPGGWTDIDTPADLPD